MAPAALAVSQPALTKAIKELEEGFPPSCSSAADRGGVDRQWRKFYQHASLILEELRAAQDELLQRREQAGQIWPWRQRRPVADAVGDLPLSSAASAGEGADHGGQLLAMINELRRAGFHH